jgi:hypothetical protein
MTPPGFSDIEVLAKIARDSFGTEWPGRLHYKFFKKEMPVFRADHDPPKLISQSFWKAQERSDVARIVQEGGNWERRDLEPRRWVPFIVRSDDINRLFPIGVESQSPASGNVQAAALGMVPEMPNVSDTSPPATRGRPPKYDWDVIWAEMAAIMYHEDPKTQEAMIEAVQLWYDRKFGDGTTPQRSVLQRKVRLLFSAFRNREKSR